MALPVRILDHIGPGTEGRYPSAVHLDNASHVELLPTVATADPRKMVYIGSIDRRVDFEWLDALAANDVTVEIFGSVHIDAAAETQQALDELIGRRRNVSFHGPYDNDDLPAILARFGVGLLPYRVGHPMTDHVNPDKLHHYLNAGLAVVASPIPAASRLGRYIHVTATAGDWAGLLNELETSRLQESWPRESNTWNRRWAELVNLVLPDESATLTPPGGASGRRRIATREFRGLLSGQGIRDCNSLRRDRVRTARGAVNRRWP